MDKGYSVVVGMTLAYAVSFFGMLLAYVVYQRNHNDNELWRRRPVGVSFFSAVYGYMLPAVLVLNALLTLANELETTDINQEMFKRERPYATRERNQAYNNMWSYVTRVRTAAQLVFADNPVQKELFDY